MNVFDLARRVRVARTIHITPTVHLPNDSCTDDCGVWFRAFPSRPIRLEEVRITFVWCERDQKHVCAFTQETLFPPEFCADCTFSTFLPEAEVLYVLASSRERELEIVAEYKAEQWTPFSEADALGMLHGNQNITRTVVADDTDDALMLVTPAMLRLIISGRLRLEISRKEQ